MARFQRSSALTSSLSGFLIAFATYLFAAVCPVVALAGPPRVWPVPEAVFYAVLLVIGSGVSVFASVPLARFLLRMGRIGVTDRVAPGWNVKHWLNVAAVEIVFILPAFAFLVVRPPIGEFLVSGPGTMPPDAGGAVAILRYLAVAVPILLVVLVPGVVVGRKTQSAEKILEGPFVLFLRRFSTLADLSGVIPVLRATVPGVPTVMLVEELDWEAGMFASSRGGNWDPLVLGFTGFSFRRPFASMPLYLRSTAMHWEWDVKWLIERAACVVIDVSDVSSSVRKEIGLLQTRADSDRIVWLREVGGDDDLKAVGLTSLAARCIPYSLRWRDAAPRIMLAALLAVLMVRQIVVSIEGAGMSSTTDVISTVAVYALGILALKWILVRPVLSRSSAGEIREAVRERVGAAPAR